VATSTPSNSSTTHATPNVTLTFSPAGGIQPGLPPRTEEAPRRNGALPSNTHAEPIDLGFVEQCREVFREVFAAGTREERRHFARLFVKKIELEPDTGDILMHLNGRPTMLAPMQTPASKETGVRIELVAGARHKAIHDTMGERLVRHWSLPRNRRGALAERGINT